MDDYLKSLPPAQVAAWYRRLADMIAKKKLNDQEPLASVFLRHWLDNRDPKSTFSFAPPKHLKESSYVTETLEFHRKVFLTEEKGKFHPDSPRYVGILPRLKGMTGFTKWDGNGELKLEYQCNVEVGNGIMDLLRIQQNGTEEEKDLLTSLRGFQLKSKVVVNGTAVSKELVRITFTSWECYVTDRYDWDYNEYFTVPNPDFNSKAKDAVRPQDQKLRVYHKNAERLEKANLAAPYDVKSESWSPTKPSIVGKADVNPTKSL